MREEVKVPSNGPSRCMKLELSCVIDGRLENLSNVIWLGPALHKARIEPSEKKWGSCTSRFHQRYLDIRPAQLAELEKTTSDDCPQ